MATQQQRRYRIKVLPLDVHFPKSWHRIHVVQQEGGGNMQGTSTTFLLLIDNHNPGDTRSRGCYRLASAPAADALAKMAIEAGIAIDWPSGPATILEKAAREGHAERLA